MHLACAMKAHIVRETRGRPRACVHRVSTDLFFRDDLRPYRIHHIHIQREEEEDGAEGS